jgi:hypothetical protein
METEGALPVPGSNQLFDISVEPVGFGNLRKVGANAVASPVLNLTVVLLELDGQNIEFFGGGMGQYVEGGNVCRTIPFDLLAQPDQDGLTLSTCALGK